MDVSFLDVTHAQNTLIQDNTVKIECVPIPCNSLEECLPQSTLDIEDNRNSEII